MKKYLFIISLALCTLACEENDPAPLEPVKASELHYLVFGQFASGMSTDDSQLFRVSRSVFEKQVVTGIFKRLDYDFEPETTMTQAEWNNAHQLIDLLPESLINGMADTYGCPDCADQGGYFLEFGNADFQRKVLLDLNDTEDQNEDIRGYKAAMSTLLLLWVD